MLSAKTVAGVVLVMMTTVTARADGISASANSWVFFGNPSTLQSQFPSADGGTGSNASDGGNAWAPQPSSAAAWVPTISSTPASAPPVPSIQSSQAFTPVTSPANSAPFSAFINLGSGPYPSQSNLVTGAAAPWYTSPSVTAVFGGNVPNASQQQAFENQVLQDVQHTFSLSGMNPTLTINPNSPALHTLSVVSGVSYGSNPNAIGITDVGGNGFSFIDKLSYGSSVSDLEWAVAHNVSHELMHAFGLGYHPDQSGKYIDAADASWSMLVNPNTMFSPLATQVISATGYGSNGSTSTAPGLQKIDGDQEILAAPVPEPATIALWATALAALAIHARRKARKAPAA